jgi:CspA family cold shock protein
MAANLYRIAHFVLMVVPVRQLIGIYVISLLIAIWLHIRPFVGAQQQWSPDVATGTVKWFNPTKGYGFVQPQSGGKDVFVHISAVERAGLSTLNEGAVVEYDIVANKGKESAENIKVK